MTIQDLITYAIDNNLNPSSLLEEKGYTIYNVDNKHHYKADLCTKKGKETFYYGSKLNTLQSQHFMKVYGYSPITKLSYFEYVDGILFSDYLKTCSEQDYYYVMGKIFELNYIISKEFKWFNTDTFPGNVIIKQVEGKIIPVMIDYELLEELEDDVHFIDYFREYISTNNHCIRERISEYNDMDEHDCIPDHIWVEKSLFDELENIPYKIPVGAYYLKIVDVIDKLMGQNN